MRASLAYDKHIENRSVRLRNESASIRPPRCRAIPTNRSTGRADKFGLLAAMSHAAEKSDDNFCHPLNRSGHPAPRLNQPCEKPSDAGFPSPHPLSALLLPAPFLFYFLFLFFFVCYRRFARLRILDTRSKMVVRARRDEML